MVSVLYYQGRYWDSNSCQKMDLLFLVLLWSK